MKLGLCQFGRCCCSLRASCSSTWLQNLFLGKGNGTRTALPRCTDGDVQPSTLFITLSNKWLVFLDRGKSTLEAEGKRREQPPGSVAAAGAGAGGSGTGSPAGSVAGAVCVPLGALCSVCVPISGLEEQTGKWFFCSLIAAHKQSTSFSRCCSQRQR